VGGIDLHAHLAPSIDLGIDPSSHGLRGIGTAEDGRLTEDGTPLGPIPLYRPELLTAYLDRADLDQAVVSIPPPFFRQDQSSDDAARWARAVNDGLLAAVAAHPRLLPLAYLPLEYPEVAVAVYRSQREDARFVGVVGAAGGRSVSLADDRFGELWKLMDDDRKLLLLHPGVSPDDRLTPFYLQNLLGNPVETAVATAELVFGDILARHPGLRVLLVHCGGCVPAVAGRWQHGVATGRPGLRALSESPEQTLRRIYVDCLAHDPSLVDHAVSVFGEDRLVLGSDWPFPMGTDDPRALVSHRGDEFAERVAEHNARNLLG
jgi:aminocarboxymuconate-semialdehyde decarboxylase